MTEKTITRAGKENAPEVTEEAMALNMKVVEVLVVTKGDPLMRDHLPTSRFLSSQ